MTNDQNKTKKKSRITTAYWLTRNSNIHAANWNTNKIKFLEVKTTVRN
jgi:hypothetical protein